jgi:hypothetical protein
MENTLEQIVKQSDSEKYSYPDIFTDNIGLDILIPEKKLHAEKSWGHSKDNTKRRATLEITTFCGISFGAIHYYGNINIQGINLIYDDEPDCGTMISDDKLPLANYSYKLELKRPLTEKEINKDPERWTYYNVGDMTNCFETIDEIIELAKEVFRLRFKGDWEFVVDSPYKSRSGKIINGHFINENAQ